MVHGRHDAACLCLGSSRVHRVEVSLAVDGKVIREEVRALLVLASLDLDGGQDAVLEELVVLE